MTAVTGKPVLDAAEFEALYQRLRQVPAWGTADRRGALNYLTPDRVLAAATEIRLGRTVSLAAPIETSLTPDDPAPAIHEMAGKSCPSRSRATESPAAGSCSTYRGCAASAGWSPATS